MGISNRAWFGCACALASAGLMAVAAVAAISPPEAGRLKNELTPLGAERAGNKAGTIPAWEGGYTQVWPGYKSGQPRPDPLGDEKPLFQVTGQNLDRYGDKLSEGTKTLLGRFASYRLDVYPTHRTAAAPEWVYENTFKNATRAQTKHAGVSIEGVFGGVPFPVPKTGAETIWNSLLAWKGESASYEFKTYVVASGKPVLAGAGQIDIQYPYYRKDGSLEEFDGLVSMVKVTTTAPPFKVGENFVIHEPLDQYNQGRQAWQYLVGQRRVRRAPTIAYDNPNTVTSGFTFFDEAYLFNGALDRYSWKLLGKQEVFVPYNTQKLHTKKISEVLAPNHLNPDILRWELHRVWVVEATLAPGKRHVMPKRRFYLDEDSWQILLVDGWDARGQLWHTGQALSFIAPELPALVTVPYVIFDLLKGGYVASSLLNEGRRQWEIVPRRPDSYFSPGALAGEGIR